MSRIDEVKTELIDRPKTWLITGVAGFIGSNILEELLHLGQTVYGLDNFSTGYRQNLDDVKESVGTEKSTPPLTMPPSSWISVSVT